jgi:hypothetical protein
MARIMSKHGLCAVVWVVLVFALTGRAAWADPPLCSQVSEEQAAVILGAPVQPGTEMAAPIQDTCVFAGAATGAELGFTWIETVSPSLAQELFGQVSRSHPGFTVEAVSGLGDSAMYLASANQDKLLILAGPKIYTLEADESGNPGIKAALVAEGHKLLGS